MGKKMRFDELFKVGSAKRVLKSQWKEEGVPFYRGREVTKLSMNGSVNNQLFITKSHFEELKEKHGVPNVGDIIMTAIGTIGNAYIVKNNDEFYFKDASVLWLNKTSNILSKYVDYFIKSDLFKSQLDRGNGATVDTLTIKKLASIEIGVPSLQEQQLIIAKFDAAFSEIDKAYGVNIKLIESIEKIQKTLLKSLLKKENKIKKVKLEDICIIKGRIGYRGYTKKDITTKGMGAISLSPSNINNNKLVFKKTTYVSWDKYNESPEIMIYSDDIIFCKTGSTYGKTAYINDLPEKATLNPQLIVLKNIKCNNKFLFYSMLTDNFKFQIEDIIGGSAMPTLSQKDLSQTEILLPPENIQQNIVNKIEKITKYSEQMNSIIKSKIKNFLSLKEKILQKEIN